jgi:hypothetical protein
MALLPANISTQLLPFGAQLALPVAGQARQFIGNATYARPASAGTVGADAITPVAQALNPGSAPISLGTVSTPVSGVTGAASTAPAAARAAEVVLPEAAGAAEAASPGLLAQLGGKAALGKAALPVAGGFIAKGIYDNITGGEKDGSWDNAIGGAIEGAGMGAGVGMLGGPLDFVSVPVGAGVGALAGGVYGWLTGKDSNSTQMQREVAKQDGALDKLVSMAGLSAEAQRSLSTQLYAATQQATNKTQIQQIYQSVMQQVPTIQAQEQQQRQQLVGLLATQQALAPQFDTYLQGLGADAKAFQGSVNDMASQIQNPTQAAYMKQLGSSSVLSDSATRAAYQAQAQSNVAQMAGQIGAPQSIYNQLIQQYG